MSFNILKITKEARELFDSFDTDNDGAIKRSELRSLIAKISKQMGLPEPSDKDFEIGFKSLDQNKNDLIEFNEFMSFYKQIYEKIKN